MYTGICTDDILTGIFTSNGWFRIHKALIHKFGLDGAAVLSFLIDYYGRVKKSNDYEENEGWFYCTVDRMEEELAITGKVQWSIITKLCECDNPPLETTKMGIPARRFFRVHSDVLLQIVSDWGSPCHSRSGMTSTNQSGMTSASQPGMTHVAKQEETRHEESNMVSPPFTATSKKVKSKDNDRLGVPPTNNFCEEWGTKLKQLLMVCDPTSRMASARIGTYANHIRKLLNKIDKSKIEKVLSWYCNVDHYSYEFTPKLYQADQIYDDFGRIERAMNNWYKDHGEEIISDRSKLLANIGRMVQDFVLESGRDPFGQSVQQEDIDVILSRIGEPVGSVTVQELWK